MELKATCVLTAALLLVLGALAQEQAVSETCVMHPQERRNCGKPGVRPWECREKGCCFDDTVPGFPWCFHPLAVIQEECPF